MKNKTRYGILAASVGLLLMLVIGSQSQVFGQIVDGQNAGVRGIAGTWETVVTPRNCSTGEPVAPPFRGILSFHMGGTMSGTSTVAPAVFGTWTRRKSIWQSSFAFISLRFNPSGLFIGSQIVRQEAEISATDDEFTSAGTVEIYDAGGTLVGNGCASSTGARFD